MKKKMKQIRMNVYSLNGLGFELVSIINREEKLLLNWAGARYGGVYINYQQSIISFTLEQPLPLVLIKSRMYFIS